MDLHSIMREAHAAVVSTQRRAYIDVNNTLVNVSRNLDAIPLVKVDPYIFAVDPMRVTPATTDLAVFVYGFFPDVSDSHKATVRIGQNTIVLTRYTGNRLSFALPKTQLKEGTFIDFMIAVPKKILLGTWTSDVTFSDRIYVGKTQPFAVTITPRIENPDLYATIASPGELHYNADSNNVSVIKNISPKELFSASVPNAGDYDIESAILVDMKYHGGIGQPCEHAPAAWSFTGWDANHVAFSLSAGSVGYHCHSLFDCRGGGGSNADIWIRPTFRVNKKTVPTELPISEIRFLAKRLDSVQKDLDPKWTSVDVIAEFQDGDEKWREAIPLSRVKLAAAEPYWNVQIDHDKLLLRTF